MEARPESRVPSGFCALSRDGADCSPQPLMMALCFVFLGLQHMVLRGASNQRVGSSHDKKKRFAGRLCLGPWSQGGCKMKSKHGMASMTVRPGWLDPAGFLGLSRPCPSPAPVQCFLVFASCFSRHRRKNHGSPMRSNQRPVGLGTRTQRFKGMGFLSDLIPICCFLPNISPSLPSSARPKQSQTPATRLSLYAHTHTHTHDSTNARSDQPLSAIHHPSSNTHHGSHHPIPAWASRPSPGPPKAGSL